MPTATKPKAATKKPAKKAPAKKTAASSGSTKSAVTKKAPVTKAVPAAAPKPSKLYLQNQAVMAELKKTGYIALDKIAGVDLNDGTYKAHADFSNPKNVLRKDILDSLKTAVSPVEIPAIEVWLHTDGNIVCTEGDHRIINAIRQFMKGNRGFLQIKAEKTPVADSLEAQVRQALMNIEGRRGNTTEAEEVGVVERLLRLGKDEEFIRSVLGGSSHTERWMNSVKRVLAAHPSLKEAVKEGDISRGTADKIASQVPFEEQQDALKKAVRGAKDGKSENEVRQDMGLRKGRPKFARWSGIQEYVAGLFEPYKKSMLTEHQEGAMEAIFKFFGFVEDPKTNKAYTKKERIELLQPIYDDYMEKTS